MERNARIHEANKNAAVSLKAGKIGEQTISRKILKAATGDDSDESRNYQMQSFSEIVVQPAIKISQKRK